MIKDLTGKKFNKLTALFVDCIKKTKTGTKIFWLCQCECGNKKTFAYTDFVYGGRKSCGCMTSKIISENKSTHKMSKTRFYRTYKQIKRRCSSINSSSYKYYGGRGIKNEWRCFEEFRDDMYNNYLKHIEEFGEKETTIDRINVNGNYCKENCEWATYKEQNSNTRRNIWIVFNNERHTVQQWSLIIGVSQGTINFRIKSGWPIEKILNPQKHINQFI